MTRSTLVQVYILSGIVDALIEIRFCEKFSLGRLGHHEKSPTVGSLIFTKPSGALFSMPYACGRKSGPL